MAGYPRLHVDEVEPPAPLPFAEACAGVPGRGAASRGARSGDAGSQAEEALERAQRALDALNALNEQGLAAFPFPRPGDDDGPRAA